MKIRVGGNSLAVRVHRGKESAILLIHGNSSCKEIFRHQETYLMRRGHTVIIPDLPGHGSSSDAVAPTSTYSFPGYAAALKGVMDHLGIASFHVIGWSLGGHIGIEMWSRMRAVRSLLISGTPPIRLSPAGVADGFLPSPVMDLAGKRDFTPADVTAYGSAMLGKPLDRGSCLAAMIERTDGRARYWMVRNGLAERGKDEIAAVARCAKPLAIVQGRRDAFVRIEHVRKLTYRHLWLHRPILMDAGHAAHWESPDAFNRWMGRFLKYVD
ncbi:alpha/beta fold hydrolase [Bradyrhizobium sp. CCBAU 51753]|uniref:alpha/beta fold hydrolase n=1 Tax=Bradyrhizobium sp. CCBAU 51753 TaxID=1325100 RepID=UPI001FED4B75|nr:alpha/beta hydrolase [Bradyrhizobium sp. CCBAU 51753]